MMLNRKWLVSLSAIVITGGVGAGIYANLNASGADSLNSQELEITAYRSPNCGCCVGWLDHLEEAGFQVTDQVTENIQTVKGEHNVPRDLSACHTAVIGDYVVEGHIPASDIKRLLVEQPDVDGIAVPGMPIGSPGMESGDIQEPYNVYTFTENGNTEIYQQYEG